MPDVTDAPSSVGARDFGEAVRVPAMTSKIRHKPHVRRCRRLEAPAGLPNPASSSQGPTGVAPPWLLAPTRKERAYEAPP